MKKITLKSYCGEHIGDFTVHDFCGWQNAEPFENVREQIRRTLVRQRAEDAAAGAGRGVRWPALTARAGPGF